MAKTRRIVTFNAEGFNVSENRPYFMNPENYGDDLARAIADECNRRGLNADEVDQEDHGWFFTFQHGGRQYDFIVGYRGDDWAGWIEHSAGLIASLLGKRNRDVEPEAASVIHSVLNNMPGVSNIRWHRSRDFDAAKEDLGTSTP